MQKRILLMLAAVVTAIFVIAALIPEPKATVLVAAYNLPAGHTLRLNDLTARELPRDSVPADTLTHAEQAVGQMLAYDRRAGDFIAASQFGDPIQLGIDERGVAVRVTDSTGGLGLIRPGQMVGVTAIVFDSNTGEAFSKVALQGLRVLYVPEDFENTETVHDGSSASLTANSRESESTVMLAVPTADVTIPYNFLPGRDDVAEVMVAQGIDPQPGEEIEFDPFAQPAHLVTVNQIELLQALDQADNAVLAMYLEPTGANTFSTSGAYLPELVTIPTAEEELIERGHIELEVPVER